MIIGLLKEPSPETRVSLLAEATAALTKKNITVWVESGAGEKSFCSNADYEKAGAVIKDRAAVLAEADLVLSIQVPADGQLKTNAVLIGVFQPLFQQERMAEWAKKGYSVFSLDMLPRTTRAQAMDVLSSQANIAGYKAVLLASNVYSRYFPMFMTAAGSIATARRLGAVVEVFDTRPAVKEEVMSLGAKFVEVEGAADASKAGGYAVEQTEEYKQKQQQRIKESIAKADIVITTAQIPGKKAPILITEDMLKGMRSGSVIIDIAASTGGNTPFTKDQETVMYNGVSIIGQSSLPATMPSDASKLYGKNVLNFLQLITTKEGALNLNWEDDLVKGSCICHGGAIVHERLKA